MKEIIYFILLFLVATADLSPDMTMILFVALLAGYWFTDSGKIKFEFIAVYEGDEKTDTAEQKT